MKNTKIANQQAFTLVELVIAIVIISIALIGTMNAVFAVGGHSADPLVMHQAIAIGESYIDEISTKNFDNPCPAVPAPGGRANYTSICHYSGLSEAPHDQTGAAIASLSQYNVSVTTDFAAANLNGLTGANNVARIDVTVTGPKLSMTFSAYRTSY